MMPFPSVAPSLIWFGGAVIRIEENEDHEEIIYNCNTQLPVWSFLSERGGIVIEIRDDRSSLLDGERISCFLQRPPSWKSSITVRSGRDSKC